MSTTPEENNNGDYPTRRIENQNTNGANRASGDGNLAPDAVRSEQNEIAARILGIDAAVAAQKASVVEGTNSIYVPGNEGAVIVAPDRTHLFARGDVAKNEHIAAFWDGQRGNYEVPVEEVIEEKKTSGPFIAGVVIVVAVIVAIFAYLILSPDADEDAVDDQPLPSPTETVDPTPTPTETETETAEPTPTETETLDPDEQPGSAPAPTDEETLPTEEPQTNGDEEEEIIFDPANVSINTGGVFVEDEANDVSGSGFLPDAELNFSIPEVNLGSVTTDSDGEFEAEITIQGPFADDTVDLTIVGPASENTEITESIELDGSMDNEEG